MGTENNTPITGDQSQDYEENPLPPPNKKKKIKPPTSLNSSINEENTDDNNSTSGSGTQEIEIVFKLHPEMLADINHKEVVKAMKDNATRFIKTASRALIEHLCKYLAMRIALDLAKTTSSSSQPQSTEGGGGGLAAAAPPSSEPPTSVTTSDGTSSASSAAAASASTTATSTGGSVKDLTIFIASVPGQLTPLTPSLSLTQVNEKYWKVNKPLEMFYRFTRV